jgi:hypothetical protein
VTVTPLTGLFMSLIYFYAPRKASWVSDVEREEDDSINVWLSKPLLKRIPMVGVYDEESPFVWNLRFFLGQLTVVCLGQPL